MDSGERVFLWACHVDYWYSAPTDPFEDAWCAERQSAYAQLWNEKYIYTPQGVVNGQQAWAFVGSNEIEARTYINAALEQPVTTGVTLWVESAPGDDPLVLTYQVVDPPADYDLVVVLVERDVDHAITGGECAGDTLHHDNSMREYFVVPDATEGEITLPWAAEQVWENSSVIGWIQVEGTHHIVGATQTHLDPALR